MLTDKLRHPALNKSPKQSVLRGSNSTGKLLTVVLIFITGLVCNKTTWSDKKAPTAKSEKKRKKKHFERKILCFNLLWPKCCDWVINNDIEFRRFITFLYKLVGCLVGFMAYRPL